MSSAASGLQKLHRLHLRRREFQERLERGPAQIEARRRFTATKQEELKALGDQLLAQKKAADQKNLQLKTNESKIAELRAKLNAAKSNREFDIIKGQIEADTMANSVLEDEILDALDKIDRAKAAVGRLEEVVRLAQDEEKRIEQAVADAEPQLRKEVETLDAAIRDAESAVPGKVLTDYRRLVHAYGADALAPAEKGTCTSCYVDLSPQIRVEVNAGKGVLCHNCGRLLYRVES